MYFLDGERLYIKPKKACGSFEDQLEQCLDQLEEINTGREIYKLNFFVDIEQDSIYDEINTLIKTKAFEKFQNKLLLNLIAQPPLTCKVIVEVFVYNPKVWTSRLIEKGNDTAMLFKHESSEILIGNVHSNKKASYREDADAVFFNLKAFLEDVKFPVSSIVRQWNYLEDIVCLDGDNQNYQEFNNARSGFYGTSFEKTGYPAATGIGTNSGGLIVEFVAVNSTVVKTFPVDNEEQISAHKYSKEVLIGVESELKTTPKFERARYFELLGKKMIFISGTASILGEKTVGIGDPVEQTKVTIENIKRLYSENVLEPLSGNNLQPKYGHARVYIKNRKDFAAIRRTFRLHFGNLPVVYIIADVCRDDLLVEIEGKVILE